MADPIKVAQGTTVRIKLTITDTATPPVAIDVTSATFYARIGWANENREDDVTLTVTKTTPATGIVHIELPDTVTAVLDPRRTYTVDCMMTLSAVKSRVYKGTFQFDFTRAIA
jgi:GTP cyclohydrolase III